MDAVFYHPAGHKHTFRGIEVKYGKADLIDTIATYKGVPVSEVPKEGHCVIIGGERPKVSKPSTK